MGAQANAARCLQEALSERDLDEVPAMKIRKEATYDGVWTVFVGRSLCISDLSADEAEALIEAFSRIAADAR
jgi:hypothetical protein